MIASESWDQLATAHIELALQYADCAVRHQAVVQAYQEPAGNPQPAGEQQP